ncbi:MAG: helix-turn-helix domain-containing protein [Lachnospiraceae bacterium]|nr:helix-turn-helix domain-containing protein [Lachnospiraceae bacterium]
MISNQRIQEMIQEITDISKTQQLLYDRKGAVVASTVREHADMQAEVLRFLESAAEIQTLSDYHFFKISAEDEVLYILLVKADRDEAYMVGRLAVCQLRGYVLGNREQTDRNGLIRDILTGRLSEKEVERQAKKLHIAQEKRLVYVIGLEEKPDALIMELMENLVDDPDRDFLTELGEDSLVLVKDAREMKGDGEALLLAKQVVDHLQTEGMVKTRVGYGNFVQLLPELTKSYQEARLALEVGRIFYEEREIVSYSRLGIGRLIYQLPQNLCEMFLQEIFGDRMPDLDEETLITIQKFFENSLNISETARQLYIHRNTLVYRLERLEKIIGLDIRKFEDAMTFKIARMVAAHMNHQN